MMHHRWECLLFLHWRIPAEQIQATLPQGLYVDTFEREAYIGITPFFMKDVRPVKVPAVAWLSDFLELNVRTYVHDEHGVPGVWFYSLDCSQPFAVAGARFLTGLPYFQAQMDASSDGYINYSSRRRGTTTNAKYRFRGAGSERQAEVESLEFFLLERYYLFAVRRGRLLRAQVSHSPYEYRDADIQKYSIVPVQLAGFHELKGALAHSCFVDGLDVKVYATQVVD
jgi:uncharacterized protein YqjF (DUF2071 family)